MAYAFIDGDTEGIGAGAAKSGDVMASTLNVKQAVQSRIMSLRWEGSAGDSLRMNGERISAELDRAIRILQNKQEALTFTQGTYSTANADATSLFRAVNPGTGTTASA